MSHESQIPNMPRFGDSSETEATDPFGLPICTLVGSPIHPRPPAPLGKAISLYLERYPPQLDDAVVVDMDLFPGGPVGPFGRIRRSAK